MPELYIGLMALPTSFIALRGQPMRWCGFTATLSHGCYRQLAW
jgi:hypothetical protein